MLARVRDDGISGFHLLLRGTRSGRRPCCSQADRLPRLEHWGHSFFPLWAWFACSNQSSWCTRRRLFPRRTSICIPQDCWLGGKTYPTCTVSRRGAAHLLQTRSWQFFWTRPEKPGPHWPAGTRSRRGHVWCPSASQSCPWWPALSQADCESRSRTRTTGSSPPKRPGIWQLVSWFTSNKGKVGWIGQGSDSPIHIVGYLCVYVKRF